MTRDIIMKSVGYEHQLSHVKGRPLMCSLQTFELKHTRDREAAADRYAMDLFVRAYGHSGGTIDMFKLLARQENGIKRPDIVSTHPDTLWRIQTLSNYIQLKKYPQGSVLPFPEPGVLPFPNDKREKIE